MGGLFVSKDLIDIEIRYIVTDGDSPPIILRNKEDEFGESEKRDISLEIFIEQNKLNIKSKKVEIIEKYNSLDEQQKIDFLSKNKEEIDKRLIEKEQAIELKNKDKIKILKTKWARQNWRLSNEMTRDSMTFNSATGEPMIDIFRLRDLRVKKFLKEWDLKDNNTQPVPCNEDMIDSLHPVIVSTLVDRYNQKMLPKDEEQKN